MLMPSLEALLDGGEALGGARDLHEEVGLVDVSPQPSRRLDRAGGVASELGGDLDGDEAITSAAAVVHRAQDGERVLDVGLHELPVRLLDGLALAHELGELLVVVGRAGDGLGEDRRVRRDAAHAALDPLLQLAAGDPAPLQVVEPRALPLLLVQVVQLAHAVRPLLSGAAPHTHRRPASWRSPAV